MFLSLFFTYFLNAITLAGAAENYKWEGCENIGKCPLNDYTDPPLVIMSFDGFALEYLDRNIVRSLQQIADCGVKAEKVYPSFPSKTFPNHHTMMTGLWPEVHGVIDNFVMDISIAPYLENMQYTKDARYYLGEPIWSVYKKQTGKKAHCLFWPGCSFNTTGYAPDVSQKYDRNVSLRQRMTRVIEWLQLPVTERPGLITFYYHEPDSAGHKQKCNEDVNKILRNIEAELDYFMEQLLKKNLLECINLVIVSDHGMQKLNKRVYYDDLLKHIPRKNKFVASNSVVGRIHLMNTTSDIEKLATRVMYRKNKYKKNICKVYTRNNIPTRKHYSKSERIGDIILEGYPGVIFSKNNKYKKLIFAGDHGYDYLNPNVQTIFFARGPSFKSNVTMPPLQNVQYMNLWMHLLKIDGVVENNGTIGFFDKALTNPPVKQNPTDSIGKCSIDTAANGSIHVTGEGEDTKMPCHVDFAVNYFYGSFDYCYKAHECTVFLTRNNENDTRRAITEYWEEGKELTTAKTSLTTLQDTKSYEAAHFQFSSEFVHKVLTPLQELSKTIHEKYSNITVLSGLASDNDHDGNAVTDSTSPTHFFRAYLTCDHEVQANVDNVKVLAFIFPLDNPLYDPKIDTNSYLLDYTATIHDIEQIAGFKFNVPNLTPQENAFLTNRVNTKLDLE